MSGVLETHHEAMAWAEEGQFRLVRGDRSGAREAFRKAMELEREAACTAGDTEPDRSVLLRSAGSLALNCDELRTAEQLLATGLAGEPPEEIADEIRDLLEQVHFRRNLELRGMTLDGNEVQTSPGRSVALTKSRDELGDIVSPEGPADPPNLKVTVTGTLRYADAIGARQGTIKLEDEDGAVYVISVPEGMMADIVRPLWDDVVRVTGVRRRGRIELDEIARAED